MKKLISLLLALTLCLGLTVTVSVSAASSDFVIRDGVLMEYVGPGGAVTIPDSVTVIAMLAFSDCTTVTSVTIPNSVTSIGIFAFSGCTNLVSVSIPNSVTNIGTRAFSKCTALTSITIPNSVISVGSGAFSSCTSLTSVEIPNSVTVIGFDTFSGTALTSVTIPDSVTEIGSFAFFGCDSLTSVIIPDSVTTIGNEAFCFCSSLADIYYSGSRAQWEKISVEPDNEPLTEATTHYDSPMPEVTPAPLAYASTQMVELDGKKIELQAYALKDENGNSTNYVKLRDIAMLLNGSAAQFEVGWNGSINLVTGKRYTSNGTELKTPFSGDRVYDPGSAPLKINGVAADLDAFVLLDDSGNGYTYFKLRDLGKNLGFNVGWSLNRGIFIETNKAYTDAD